MTALNRISKRLVSEQDETLERCAAFDLQRSRARFARELSERARNKPSYPHLKVAAAIGGLASVVLIASLLWIPATDSLHFTVGRVSARGQVNAWIEVSEQRSMPVRFSDGSTITLSAGALANVADLKESGARFVIARGSAFIAVAHKTDTRWNVTVGPFEALITGTRFEARWDPAEQKVWFSVLEGSIEVTGPHLQEAQLLAAGEVLQVSLTARRVVIGPRTPETLSLLSSQSLAQNLPLPEGAKQSVPLKDSLDQPRTSRSQPQIGTPNPERPPIRKATTVSWRTLITEGRYRDAVTVAERFGFKRICQQATAAELLALGEAARLAQHYRSAVEAFQSLRKRFPQKPQASVAAFTLGRIAYEQRSAYSQAADWFQTYLTEAPHGSLQREARGRLMEAQLRAGDAEGAKQSAYRYLKRHPNGPHAALARLLTSRIER
jgi:hypothetical protein